MFGPFFWSLHSILVWKPRFPMGPMGPMGPLWSPVSGHGFLRKQSYRTAPQWWYCCSLRLEPLWSVLHSPFGGRSEIHPSFCRRASFSASPKWRLCRGLWMGPRKSFQHSTVEKRTVVYLRICRQILSQCIASKWWYCSGLGPKSTRPVQDSPFTPRHRLHPSLCGLLAYPASPQWRPSRGRRRQQVPAMSPPALGGWSFLHPGVGQRPSFGASAQRWPGGGLRTSWWWTMWHSTLAGRDVIHSSCCRSWTHRAPAKWWFCSGVWTEWEGTMQHSSFGGWRFIYSNCCRQVSYRAAPERWSSRCLWQQLVETVQDSVTQVMEWMVEWCLSHVSLRFGSFTTTGYQASFPVGLEGTWERCNPTHMLQCSRRGGGVSENHQGTPNYRSRGEIPKILKLAWGKAFVEVVAMWRLPCV